MQRLAVFVVLACAFAASASAQPIDALHGDVVAVEGSRLRVRSDAGQEVRMALPDTVTISVRAPVAADAIRPGDFIATTASAQPDGTLRASEVRIFPESMRGLGEGHRPMKNKPDSTMTNARRLIDSANRWNVSASVVSPPGCVFSLRCPHVADECRAVVPLMREMRPGQQVACHRCELWM